jgi:hypothetical protein
MLHMFATLQVDTVGAYFKEQLRSRYHRRLSPIMFRYARIPKNIKPKILKQKNFIAAVLRIHDILVGTDPDPDLWLTDPDPATFVSDRQDVN